jgi:hypothetical protein
MKNGVFIIKIVGEQNKVDKQYNDLKVVSEGGKEIFE